LELQPKYQPPTPSAKVRFKKRDKWEDKCPYLSNNKRFVSTALKRIMSREKDLPPKTIVFALDEG
jgi:type I site-specific restriction endonuclease